MTTIAEMSLKDLKVKRTELEAKLQLILDEDKTEYAQNIIDKIFTEFKKGGAWTERMKKFAEEKFYVFSPIGRKRNLFAAMTGDRRIVSKQVRRGSNAPIQGFASEIGVKAGRVVNEHYNKALPKLCEMLDIPYDPWALRIPYNRMVHDANYYSVPFALVIPYIHILQWGVTYGITKAYADEFDVHFPVEPELEIEIGCRDDKMSKWDFSMPNIVKCIQDSVNYLEEFDMLEGRTKESILKEIFKPWARKESRVWLQKHYPLLNVTWMLRSEMPLE